jgi:hypothetical protein
MSTSKTQRWLDLLAVLVGRRVPVTVDQIMEQVPAYRDRWETGDQRTRASVGRMFERDKDELRSMGIPLETRRYRIEGLAETQGYVIPTRDFYLPYLNLLSSETGESDAPEGGPPGIAARATPHPSHRTSSPPSTSPHAVGQVTLSEADAGTAILALRAALSLPSFPFRPEARSAERAAEAHLRPGPCAGRVLGVEGRGRAPRQDPGSTQRSGSGGGPEYPPAGALRPATPRLPVRLHRAGCG